LDRFVGILLFARSSSVALGAEEFSGKALSVGLEAKSRLSNDTSR